MHATSSTSSKKINTATPLTFKAAKKKVALTPKQSEVLDWIENFIVPALVDQYIEDKILNPGASRA